MKTCVRLYKLITSLFIKRYVIELISNSTEDEINLIRVLNERKLSYSKSGSTLIINLNPESLTAVLLKIDLNERKIKYKYKN